MKWIKVQDQLPKPFEVVWIYWRDRHVLLGCRTYEGKEETECPSSEGWYSFDYEKCRSTNHWMPISRETLDKPFSPHEEE